MSDAWNDVGGKTEKSEILRIARKTCAFEILATSPISNAD